MAIEIFPDSPRLHGISPRISFSHDLSQTDTVPVEQYIRSSSASSSIDFDFCVFRETLDHEAPSADELFFDGKILPIEVKKRLVQPKKLPSLPQLPPVHPPMENQESVKPTDKKTPVPEQEEKPSSKSWFKRSTSLNCGSGYGRTLCPLPLLSRSNSTGSTGSGNGKRSSTSQKQSLLKTSVSNSSQKQQQQQSGYSSKPPLKKNSNSYGNGAKFNPVLNVPPANMFGLGSIFSGGRDKTRRR